MDVIAVVTDHDFILRFDGDWRQWLEEGQSGNYDLRWRWARECSKQWRAGCCETNLNLDFKIYAAGYLQDDKRPVYRLDSNPYTWIDKEK